MAGVAHYAPSLLLPAHQGGGTSVFGRTKVVSPVASGPLSSLDDEVHFHVGPERQRGHPDRRAGREGRPKMLCVDGIHRGVVTQVREKYAGARHVIETPAGRLEHGREILEDAFGLGPNAPLDDLAGGRVLADLTAEVEETTDFDRLAERADRRRQLGRGNCGLAHGTLLSGCGVGGAEDGGTLAGNPIFPQVQYAHDHSAISARWAGRTAGRSRNTRRLSCSMTCAPW